jgi:cobalamin biosynthetic protein CobC
MKHGGDLSRLRGLAAGGEKDWLDLSTGIAPIPYPFGPLPQICWPRLPQPDRLAALLDAARKAYGAPQEAPITAAPGAQMLIQMLPLLKAGAKVAIAGPTYGEHEACWARFGAKVTWISELNLPPDSGVLVAVNPNNPDGRIWPREALLAAADELARRGGFLVLDESFADAVPEVSLASEAGRQGLIVLRSFGKFFGLAGLRLGFALGPEELIRGIDALLGPWAVSGPAIEIGIEALADAHWIANARLLYAALGARLDGVLREAGFGEIRGAPLFRLARHERARDIHRALLRRGILTRVFDWDAGLIRFSLPGSDAGFARLSRALGEAMAAFSEGAARGQRKLYPPL